MTEVGELAREINHHFGEKKIQKKIIQLKLNWETIYLFYCVLQTL